ncbi:protein shisa-4 isoform X2 [Myotis myotis]|uniref:Shisa family member 4 n=2 Tax=Myotis myotis TaxID=51298 RepID=A0A7J7RVJ9_MYOMY|nr:protein shisa-4 isoform X2 [Myotis myotis]KAF6280027.1 shisa family member 4 [Myotis myotis]
MPLTAIALLLLGAPLALASTDCLGYLDEADSWRLGFSCEPLTFCCGTCRQRYCCGDRSLRLSEFQQKRCLVFSPKFVVGLVTAVTLFMAMVAICCCCFCICRYLVRRRQRLLGPSGQDIPMRGALQPAMYPYPPDSKADPTPPPQGFMWPPNAPPQPPLYPAGPPVYSPAAPPPYLPQQRTYPGT